MPTSLCQRYHALVASGELKHDPLQEAAARRLQMLAAALKSYRPHRWPFRMAPPRGLYTWGDVGRGKSMLMDLFFEAAPIAAKRRIHFNAFITEAHARIHEWRTLDHRERAKRPEFVLEAGDDPIPSVARALSEGVALICFDEFQVPDVADAMILGRLFEQLFAQGIVIVATSNTAPERLYEGGLNRQLFLPFIALIKQRLDVIELNGRVDYRLSHLAGLDLYITPLGPEADAKMDAAWNRLTAGEAGAPLALKVFGRTLTVPRAAKGVARFSFGDLCVQPLAAADYLAISRTFHTVLIDHIPQLGAGKRNEARRFIVLIDTLYDENVKLICSAAAQPAALYTQGDGVDAFRRTASRLTEMQSVEYLKRGHGAGVHIAHDIQ